MLITESLLANMAERTIILRADQVAAIRAGATQVRIPVRVPRGYELQYTATSLYAVSLYAVATETGCFRELTQPYYPGDVLRVRKGRIHNGMHLRVKNVRAQSVADITEDEAKACGFSGKGKFLEDWRLRHGSAEWAWILTVVAITEGGEK